MLYQTNYLYIFGAIIKIIISNVIFYLTMTIIENNPYRILGLISNSSAKETKESETFILRYLDIGKSADLKFDITPPLSQLERTAEIVKSAKRRIHENFDKLTHSIFWFVNSTVVDKVALEKLSSEKNIEKAMDSFKKGGKDFTISKKTYSSIINFSTLEIVSYTSHKDEERVKNAIRFKYQVIKDKIVFKEFERLITSTVNKINHKSYIDKFLENSKGLLNELFPRKDQNKLLLDIFSEDENILEEIQRKIVSSSVQKINENLALFQTFFKAQSEKTDAQIIRSRSSIVKRARKLVIDTKSDLNKLKQAVGKDNYEFSNLVNELYSYVNLAVIMCFNKEMDALNKRIQINNVSQYTGNITYPNFKLYVDILEEASKATSTINFPIKETLNKNLQGIRKNYRECQKRSREQSSYQFTGRSTYSGKGSNDSNGGGLIAAAFIGGCILGGVTSSTGGFVIGAILSAIIVNKIKLI